MADPLAPIAGNQQQRRQHHNSQGSIKSFATADTHPEEYILAKDPAAPSSPFLYEAERSSRSRSPTKSTSSPSKSAKSRSPTKFALDDAGQRIPLTEEMLRANEFSLETPRSSVIYSKSSNVNGGMAPPSASRNYSPSESAFSAFSAVPNVDMTKFAIMGLSPPNNVARSPPSRDGPPSPSRANNNRPHTPGTARPIRMRDFDAPASPGDGNTTALIDFTEQLDMAAKAGRSPVRTRNSPSKDSRDQQYNSSQRNAAGFKPATPGQIREYTNLLDFDLPPAPTPRSLPTITARELESLKASLLGEISSLKATLQGKDAEIQAHKAASIDAENRVGSALEQLREVRDIKEALEAEKADWDKRDQETQRVLKEVRAQIHATDQERRELEDRLAETERRAEDAELKAQESESKVAGAVAGVRAASAEPSGGEENNKAVQIAVEKVARELHTLYKAKHEAKVGQLKKSYEARWSKKTDALKADIDRLEKDLQESRIEVDALRHELDEAKLKSGRVDAMTTIDPSKLEELHAKDSEIHNLKTEIESLTSQLQRASADSGAQLPQQQQSDGSPAASSLPSSLSPPRSNGADQARIQSLETKVATMTAEVESLRSRTKSLIRDLETSRAENSALVATVDEFLAIDMSADDGATRSILASTVPMPDSAPSSAHPSNVGSRPGSALSSVTSAGIHSSSSSSRHQQQDHEMQGLNGPSSLSSSTMHAAPAGGISAPTPKPSGLKGPGFGFGAGQSRIGLGPPPTGFKRSVSGSKSGSMMSSIERMGRGRATAADQ